MPNGRCYMHGGATPKGPASVHFKHGRYSKYFPNDLQARYEESLNDQALLELRDDIAVIEARLKQLLEQVNAGVGSHFWSDVSAEWKVLMRAIQARDANKQSTAISRLDTLITAAKADADVWDDIASTLDQKRRLVESETRRVIGARQVLAIEQVMAILGNAFGAFKQAALDHTERDVAKLIITQADSGFRQALGTQHLGVTE